MYLVLNSRLLLNYHVARGSDVRGCNSGGSNVMSPGCYGCHGSSGSVRGHGGHNCGWNVISHGCNGFRENSVRGHNFIGSSVRGHSCRGSSVRGHA